MDCIDDAANGITLHHTSDWRGVRIGWMTPSRGDRRKMSECWCNGKDLIAGRFTPTRASDPEPPINVITRAVALAVETYLRTKMIRAAEELFVERGKLS